MKQFNEIQAELRELFMMKGWGIEIEGESPSYYKVYSAMLDFIKREFYPEETAQEKPIIKPEIGHDYYKVCKNCGRKRVYYRVGTDDYRCRVCHKIHSKSDFGAKIEKKPIKKGDDKLRCPKCNSGWIWHVKTINKQKCRKCGNEFGEGKPPIVPKKPEKDKNHLMW